MSDWQVQWTSPAGEIIDFDGEAYTVLDGALGWLLPEYVLTHTLAGGYDWYLDRVQVQPREIDFPVLVRAVDRPTLEQKLRDLAKAMCPHNAAEGTLRVTRADFLTRMLAGVLLGGLAGSQGQSAGAYWQKVVLTFKCSDPFWSTESPASVSFEASAPLLYFPIFPLVMAGGSEFATEEVNNEGDVEAWPVWTIHGPGANISLRNLTTGKDLSLSGLTLLAPDTLEIDTRVGYKTITVNGTSMFNYLAASSSLWSLTPGNNTIRVEISGIDPSTTTVMEYYERYYSL